MKLPALCAALRALSEADNPYGHPSQQPLARLAEANVRVLPADQFGVIHSLTDGIVWKCASSLTARVSRYQPK